MAYITINDWKYGMDRRRPRVAGIPGTLWELKNAHITRGGDIESAKKFVELYTLPLNTFGLAQINGQLWAFGSEDLSASMPIGVQYQRLIAPSAARMIAILHNSAFDGKHYAIAEYDDGTIHHFYDGTRIADWDALAEANSTATTLADYLAAKINSNPAVSATSSGSYIRITADVPGTPFTLTAGHSNGGANPDEDITVLTITPNLTYIAETRAAGSFTLTGGSASAGINTVSQITVNGVNLLAAPVDFILSNDATATAVAVAINDNTTTSTYSASAAANVVTITAAVGSGTAPNGFAVAATTTGDVTSVTSAMVGGIAERAAQAQVSQLGIGGTYEAKDAFNVQLNGTPYYATGTASGHGTFVFTYKSREYVTANSLLYYSQINDPDDFTDASPSSGAGFIGVTNDSDGSERLTAIAPFQNSVVIFSRERIRSYDLSTDSTQNAYGQTIDNTGTFAPRSVVPYGNVDVFYLDITGIRSIQSRSVTNAPLVDDVGSAIDTFVQESFAAGESVIERAVGVIEPTDGRLFMAIGARVYVLSFFPKAKISAWSYYEPGFSITDFVRSKGTLFARADNTVYAYGGLNGTTYPDAGETPITVELPFANAQSIATFKQWLGFDMACSGDWQVYILADPTDEAKKIDVGLITKTTYQGPQIAVVGEHPLFAMSLTCASGGQATLSNMAFHYKATEAK